MQSIQDCGITFTMFARAGLLLVVIAVLVGACSWGSGQRTSTSAEPSTFGAADECSDRPQMIIQNGAAGLITVVALGADGRILATSGAENNITLWDTYSGLIVDRIPTDGPPENLNVSTDGETLMYGWTDRGYHVRLVDTSGRRSPVAFEHAYGFSLASDGGKFALTTDRGAEIYDTNTGQSISVQTGQAVTAAFDPAGTQLAIGGSTVSIVNADSGAVEQEIQPGFRFEGTSKTYEVPPNRLYFIEGAVVMESAGRVAVATVPDGKLQRLPVKGVQQVAAGGGRIYVPPRTGPLNVFEIATGKMTAPRADSELAFNYRLTASSDGSRLAVVDGTAGRPIVRLRDGATLGPIRTLEGRYGRITGLGPTADGRRLLTTTEQGTFEAWDLRTGELLPAPTKLRAMGPAARPQIATSPGGQVAVARGNSIEVFDQSLKHVRSLTGAVATAKLSFAGEGRIIASNPAGYSAWDLSKAASAPTKLAIGTRSTRHVVSPSGQLLLAHGIGVDLVSLSDGGVLWHADAVIVPGSQGEYAAFSADEQRAAVLISGRRPGPPAPDRGFLFVFDVSSGKQVGVMELEAAGPIAFVGSQIIVGGRHPSVVDLETGTVVRSIKTRDATITAVAAHPKLEGVAFMAGDAGGTTLVSTTSGEAMVLLQSTDSGEYVAATPQGLYRSSTDGARSVAWRFGCPLEAFPFSQFASRYERPDLIVKVLSGEAVKPPEPITRPPVVRLDPAPSTVADAEVRLSASARSSQKIETLRVFVNGRPAVEQWVDKSEANVSLDVPLDPGRNRVSVVAYDAQGIASNPAVVDTTSTASTDRPDVWVVAIGVSRYPKLSAQQQLEVADDDARAISEALASQAGAGRPFAKAHVTTLLDEQVTVQSLTKALAELKKMRPADLGVVFLAGHGLKLDSGSVFLTSRASLSASSARKAGVGWDRLSGALANAQGRVLVLLDACHSGHLSTDVVVPNNALASELSGDGRAGVLVFAAARGRELSYEVSTTAGSSRGLELAWAEAGRRPSAPPPNATGHGLFTAAVLEALQGRATDLDRSSAIELGEFVAYVSERVRVLSAGRQTPWIVRQEMFGDFPIASSK